MFDASDLRGQRIVLGMPPLAPLPSRNRCAPIQTNTDIIRAGAPVVKGMNRHSTADFFSRWRLASCIMAADETGRGTETASGPMG